jgi:hypothetical protein
MHLKMSERLSVKDQAQALSHWIVDVEIFGREQRRIDIEGAEIPKFV